MCLTTVQCDFVTVNLVSLYWMKFMFHTMLSAADDVLRVHYKSMKCDVSFSQGSISTIFRPPSEVDIFHTCARIFFCLQQCKNYNNRLRFSKVTNTNVLPPSSWFTVYINVAQMLS